jgi:hypothetical protein
MKTNKTERKSITLLLVALVILQGCAVYRSNPTTMEQAVMNESKVKVQSKSNKTDKFQKIIIEDGIYYGVKIVHGETIKLPLNQNDILTIKEKNKPLSTILGIGIPVVLLGSIVVLVGENNSWEFIPIY